MDSTPDNPYAVASIDRLPANPPSHHDVEGITTSRYARITVFACRLALGVTFLCWATIALIPMPNVAVFYDGLMFSFPYALTEITARMLARYRSMSLVFMLTILALSGLRLYLAVSLACAAMQINQNSGDNMIGILPLLDLYVIVPAQLALTIACGAYAFWRNRKTRL